MAWSFRSASPPSVAMATNTSRFAGASRFGVEQDRRRAADGILRARPLPRASGSGYEKTSARELVTSGRSSVRSWTCRPSTARPYCEDRRRAERVAECGPVVEPDVRDDRHAGPTVDGQRAPGLAVRFRNGRPSAAESDGQIFLATSSPCALPGGLVATVSLIEGENIARPPDGQRGGSPPPAPSRSPGEKLPAQTLSYRTPSLVRRSLNCPV